MKSSVIYKILSSILIILCVFMCLIKINQNREKSVKIYDANYNIIYNSCIDVSNLFLLSNEDDYKLYGESLKNRVTDLFYFQYLTYWSVFEKSDILNPRLKVTDFLLKEENGVIVGARLCGDVYSNDKWKEDRVYEFTIIDNKIDNVEQILTGII